MSDLTPPAGAVWIGSPHPFDLHEAYVCFRRGFDWDGRPARLSLTADSRYRLWINGRFVLRGPARSWPSAQSVDALDLTPWLVRGRNLIAAQVYQPGYSHFAYLHRGAAGLLAWLTVGDETLLMTDPSWRARRDPSFAAAVGRVSIYGSGVERRDLRLDEPWQQPDYDDSGWATARLVAPPSGEPWTALEARALPYLSERPLPMRLIEIRRGPAVDGDPHQALLEGWRAAATTPAATTPAAHDDEWQAAPGDADTTSYWLYDLGRDYLCQGAAEIRGAAGGETLLVSYAEKVRGGEIVLPNPDDYCRMRPTDAYTLRPGDQTAEPFLMRGGRYLLFALRGGGSGLTVRFAAAAAEYPLPVARRLESDDPLLNGVIRLCEATFDACLHDGFVDSVWRESSQWLGDALPQALIMSAMSDDTRPLRRVIRMAAQGAYADGVLPSVLPGEVHAYAVVDYNFMWIELLALHESLTGDEAFTREMWPTLRAMLERFHADRRPDGLIRSQPGRRLFLDWAPLSRAEPNAVYNLHYLLGLLTAMGLTAGLAAGLGEEAALLRWAERADALREACREAFFDGLIWHDDQERTTHSQLAAALAILTGAAEPFEIPALLDAIIARSLDADDSAAAGRMVLASPFMHHYLFEALRRHGRNAAALDIIRLRWGRWVEAGYPTAWENWSVDFPDGSQCHAFSAHPRYHLQQIARARPGLGLREVKLEVANAADA